VTDRRRLGLAWLAGWAAFTAHMFDEAFHGYLHLYNPLAWELYQRYPWSPLPVLDFFRYWVPLALGASFFLLLLTPFVFRGWRRMRPLAWLLGGFLFLAGLGHMLGVLLGPASLSEYLSRPLPGLYTSPLTLAAGAFLLRELRRR
jgi:hypothetical protein